MNHTEECLRAATRAAAQTVRDAPPLRLPAEPDQLPARPSRAPKADWRRALAPLAAAAAVISVVGASVALTQHHGVPPAGPASQPAQVSLPRLAMMLVAPVHGPGAGVIMHLEVRETMTGRRLASVRPPRLGRTFCDVSGSASGRMFVAAVCSVRTRLAPKASMTVTPRQYLGIWLSRAGQVIGRRPLPIPVRPDFGSMAVSPDGSTLAVTVADATGRDPAIELFSTASGQLLHRWVWRGTAGISDRSYSGALLSWTADGRTLAFPLTAGPLTSGHRSVQTRLLDTAAPGSSLRRASRVAVNFGHVPVQVNEAGTLGNSDTLITPDGRLIVSGISPASDRPGTTALVIAEFPARPGAQAGAAPPVRTLDPVTAGGQLVLFREVLWSSTDGSTLIATGFQRLDGNSVIGVVTKSGFRPLPGSMAGVFQIAF